MFHPQIFFQLKWITLSGKFLKIKSLIAFGKVELANATYGLYILLTTILQEWWLVKYTTISQRRSFNAFSLFVTRYSFSFLLSLFKLSCTKKNQVCNLHGILYTYSFCYVVYYIVSKICIGGYFLEECFYC